MNKQEEALNEDYKRKQEELLKNASERERLLHEKAKQKMLQEQLDKAKLFNLSNEVVSDVKNAAETAIYDSGDVKSRNNLLVRKIADNQILNDDEKEQLLKHHEIRLHNIDNLLDGEKKKQEQELDRALKERLDRRHRLKDKKHGREIRAE